MPLADRFPDLSRVFPDKYVNSHQRGQSGFHVLRGERNLQIASAMLACFAPRSCRRRLLRNAALCLCLLFGVGLPVRPQGSGGSSTPTFTTIDVPAAGTGALQGTIAIATNATGDIAGLYFNPAATYHGFVCTAPCTSATMTTFEATTAAGLNQGTVPIGINAAGAIAGLYEDPNGVTAVLPYSALHGFVCANPCTSSTITPFNVPGAPTTMGNRGTSGISINDNGVIVGNWTDVNALFHGFVRTATGTITIFDAPNAGTGSHVDQGTFPIAVNTAGEITGFYKDATSLNHGFVCSAPCTPATAITPFDVSGAIANSGLFGGGTIPLSINTAGVIVGSYADANRVYHGFVRAATGTITTFDAPGASTITGSGLIRGTAAISVNTAGDITGFYVDASGVFHGFVRAANGTITTFDAPGAIAGTVTPLLLGGTIPVSINASGDIAGFYLDTNGMFHGFERMPGVTTTLTSSANPTVYGQTVTLTAAVASGDVTPPDGESISFMQGTTVLGTGTLAGGSASFVTTTLPVGSDSITAVYAGDANFVGATSTALTQVVSKAATSTVVVPSANPSTAGQSLTFTATVSVSAPGAGTPTGTVAFLDGTTSLGAPVQIASGVATLATSTLAAGSHSVTASYSGDSNNAGSTSPAVTETVTAAAGFGPAPTGLTVTAGNSLPINLTLFAPAGSGLNFTLSCAGLPSKATCSFNQNPVAPAPPPNGTTVQLTFGTSSSRLPAAPSNRDPWRMPGIFVALAALLAVGMIFWRSAPRWRLAFSMCLTVVALAMALAACGTSYNPASSYTGTAKGLTSFTVMGVSGATTISVPVSVTVQ